MMEKLMRVALMLTITVALCGCSQEAEVTGSSNACAAQLYSNYNKKDLKQCVNVCVKCDHGSVNTCTTSCTLRGAS